MLSLARSVIEEMRVSAPEERQKAGLSRELVTLPPQGRPQPSPRGHCSVRVPAGRRKPTAVCPGPAGGQAPLWRPRPTYPACPHTRPSLGRGYSDSLQEEGVRAQGAARKPQPLGRRKESSAGAGSPAAPTSRRQHGCVSGALCSRVSCSLRTCPALLWGGSGPCLSPPGAVAPSPHLPQAFVQDLRLLPSPMELPRPLSPLLLLDSHF